MMVELLEVGGPDLESGCQSAWLGLSLVEDDFLSPLGEPQSGGQSKRSPTKDRSPRHVNSRT